MWVIGDGTVGGFCSVGGLLCFEGLTAREEVSAQRAELGAWAGCRGMNGGKGPVVWMCELGGAKSACSSRSKPDSSSSCLRAALLQILPPCCFPCGSLRLELVATTTSSARRGGLNERDGRGAQAEVMTTRRRGPPHPSSLLLTTLQDPSSTPGGKVQAKAFQPPPKIY